MLNSKIMIRTLFKGFDLDEHLSITREQQLSITQGLGLFLLISDSKVQKNRFFDHPSEVKQNIGWNNFEEN